jgi:hypothetical protein
MGTWGVRPNAGSSDYEHHSLIIEDHNEVESGVQKKF